MTPQLIIVGADKGGVGKTGEHVEAAGVGFEKFCVPDNGQSETLQGYVRHWCRRVYQAFDIAGINAL